MDQIKKQPDDYFSNFGLAIDENISKNYLEKQQILKRKIKLDSVKKNGEIIICSPQNMIKDDTFNAELNSYINMEQQFPIPEFEMKLLPKNTP